jgi:hypothetical protein
MRDYIWNLKRALLLFASLSLSLSACSGSSGAYGPVGPKGDTGATGPQGLQGPKGDSGESVIAVSLVAADPNCPTGGAQFTSISGASFACNGADGSQGPQGPSGPIGPQGAAGPQGATGPQGLQGPQGPEGPTAPGGILVRDGNGADLGPSYGLMLVPMTERDGYNIPTQPVAVPLATKTAVLLAEQPAGSGAPKYLVWRTMTGGIHYQFSTALDCGFEHLRATIYYAGPGCTGTMYVSTNAVPALGTACCFMSPGAASCALVASPAPEPVSGVTYWSRAEFGTYSYVCQTQTAAATIDYVAELTEVGPPRILPAPFRLVPQ